MVLSDEFLLRPCAHFSRSAFKAPPQAMTWSNIALTDFSWRASGLKTLKFSKSVNMESKTWLRTVAICTSPAPGVAARPPRPAGAAVADEASRLVVPLAEQKINRVFERAGHAMIILRRDEDTAIKRTDLGGPCFGVRLTVLPHDGRHRLVEERQVEVFNVHEFELGVGALFRDFVDPFGNGLAVATGPRAPDDDGNSKQPGGYRRFVKERE